MSLVIILVVAVVLSVGFHFIGVYANAKIFVWIMIALMWLGSFNIAMSEIKPKGYDDLEKMKGKYSETDALIEKALPEVSIYEMIVIKNSLVKKEPKK